MRRRPFTFASFLSLLLCAGTVVLWAGSYRGYTGLAILRDSPREHWGWRDWFIYRGRACGIFTGTDVGMNSVETFGRENGDARWTLWGEPSFLASAALDKTSSWRGDWNWLGFNVWNRADGYRQIIVPLWSISVLFALLPAYAIVRANTVRQPRRGHCAACGYDLRATPERCPECGHIPKKAGVRA